MPHYAPEAIHLPDYVWNDAAVRHACAAADGPALLRIVNRKYGITQARMAYWLEVDSGEISKIINDKAGEIKSLDRWRRIANALNMPSRNRLLVLGGIETDGADRPVPESDTSVDLLPAAVEDAESDDWPVWFGIRMAGILGVINSWQSAAAPTSELQAMLHQEIIMLNAAEPETTNGGRIATYPMSRRQALFSLASLPVAFLAARPGPSAVPDVDTAAFLTQCSASLTACWHLLKGSDIYAVDRILPAYSVHLDSLARRSSPYQRTAALLASQAHRVSGIISLHRNNLRARERHCELALYYARQADDASAETAALVSLASTHFYRNDPVKAVGVYERALQHVGSLPALQESRLHAELSVVYAQTGRDTEALRSGDLAQRLYPEQPDQDHSSLYAEFTPASLALECGMMYLALAELHPGAGHERAAQGIFDRVTRHDAPDRIVYEIANHQASAAVLLDDLDEFERRLIQGHEGAVLLKSGQRLNELANVWQRATAKWPREPRLRRLRELIRPPAQGPSG